MPMTFRIDPDDPRRKLAEAEVMRILSGLQETLGFGDAVPKGVVPGRAADLSHPSDGTIVLYDYGSDVISVSEVARLVGMYREDPRYGGYDILLDGDRQAIVARPRVSSNDRDGPLMGRLRLP